MGVSWLFGVSGELGGARGLVRWQNRQHGGYLMSTRSERPIDTLFFVKADAWGLVGHALCVVSRSGIREIALRRTTFSDLSRNSGLLRWIHGGLLYSAIMMFLHEGVLI